MTGVLAPRVSPGRAHEHGVLRAWTVSVSMGELAGFCVPALVGGLLREEPPLLVLGAMVLAGLVEGAVLGWSQSRVLRHRLSGFNEARWIGATALAAAAAWFVGMLPSTFYEQWSTWPMLLSVLVAVLLGTLLLGSIGLGQWIELRRHVPRAARWILITAAGWGAGLFVFMAVATPLWRPGQSTATIIAIGVGAGALMAVSMAGLTGWGMQHLSTLVTGYAARRAAPRVRPERRPWRRTFVAVEGLVALGGAAGTVQLLAGIATPPDSALDPFERFGVSGWGLPALWLFVSVAVPSAVAAAAASTDLPHPGWCWSPARCSRSSCSCRCRSSAQRAAGGIRHGRGRDGGARLAGPAQWRLAGPGRPGRCGPAARRSHMSARRTDRPTSNCLSTLARPARVSGRRARARSWSPWAA